MASAPALNELKDGEARRITFSSGSTYELKRVGDIYSCSCPAWKYQKIPIYQRTCKHIIEFRGEEAEKYRITHVSDEDVIKMGDDMEAIIKAIKEKKVDSESKKKIELMAADVWDGSMSLIGWYMSEKVDGMRAYWDGKQLWSRQGNKIDAPDWFTEDFPMFALDGELFMGRKKFQETISIVKGGSHSENWKKIRYVVFDAPIQEEDFFKKPFRDRYEFLKHELGVRKPKYIIVLEQKECEDDEHAKEVFDDVIEKGGEGIMVKDKHSPYRFGRSSTMLKIKPLRDSEARIVGYNAGSGKNKGRIGSFEMQMPNGKRFNLSGMDDKTRDAPPSIGTIITYTYNEFTDGGIPRFPRYQRIRSDMTWEEVCERDKSDELERKKSPF